jgi:hypothetical protein
MMVDTITCTRTMITTKLPPCNDGYGPCDVDNDYRPPGYGGYDNDHNRYLDYNRCNCVCDPGNGHNINYGLAAIGDKPSLEDVACVSRNLALYLPLPMSFACRVTSLFLEKLKGATKRP